ncbi:MAG: ribonuclease P protein component [Acidobacteriaceae bacterium]
MTRSNPTEPKIDWPASRLRKHADYQRVYQASRKQFAKQMSYFFALRPALGPEGTALRHANPEAARVGLTVGKAMGRAVDRNRIRRRMREAVRRQLALLAAPVDVVLHPRQSVLELDFATLEREVAAVFRAVQMAAEKQLPAQTEPAKT